MRKPFLLLLTLVVSIVAMAGPVTPDEARRNVAKFKNPRRAAAVIQNPESLRLVHTSFYKVQDDMLAPSYYVFNIGQDKGYVIAAADDRIPAVLGYSDCGAIDPDNMPANMKAWLQGYNDQIEYLNSHPETAVARRTVSGDAIAPLLTSKWDQDSPYNDLCPLDGGERSLTGCPATAMAQIMNFWKYPAATTDLIPGYTTPTKKLVVPEIPAGTAIDWDNMLDKYKGSHTEAQAQAVAKLMLLCGTSVQMNYSAQSSGVADPPVVRALRDYFDYDDGIDYELRKVFLATEWNQRVYDELKAGRPVFYSGSSSDAGHAFVVDGYGGDDYFHVNWGWSGDSDDYYLLSILDPKNNAGSGASQSFDGYSFEQGAIFGLQPNTGIANPEVPVLTTTEAAFFCDTVMIRTDANQEFVIIPGFSQINHLIDTYKYDIGIGFFDTDGQLRSVFGMVKDVELEYNWGFQTAEDGAIDIKLNKDLNNISFVLKPVSRLSGTEKWLADKGSDTYNIRVDIKSDTLRLSAPVFNMTGTLVANGDREVGSYMPITATITNNGTLWNGQMFLLQNGVVKSGIHIDFQPGETKNAIFSLVPDSVGRFEFAVANRHYNSETGMYDYTTIVADSIDIDSATIANLTLEYGVVNDSSRIVKENVIKLIVRATNNGSKTYNNFIKANLHKNTHDDLYALIETPKKYVTIEIGQHVDVLFEYEDLEDGKYLMNLGYYTGTKWKYATTKSYTVQTQEPDGIQLVGSDAINGNAVIYGLNGNKVAEGNAANVQQRLKSLPKGLYIVRNGQRSWTVRN